VGADGCVIKAGPVGGGYDHKKFGAVFGQKSHVVFRFQTGRSKEMSQAISPLLELAVSHFFPGSGHYDGWFIRHFLSILPQDVHSAFLPV